MNDGKFGMVWIGQLNAEALEISPVAWAGYDVNALVGADTVEVGADSPRSQSMIARAVRSVSPVVSNNLTSEGSAGVNGVWKHCARLPLAAGNALTPGRRSDRHPIVVRDGGGFFYSR